MITIIPSLEVMKAVVDDNITSSASKVRRIAFDTSTDLISVSSVTVLLEGILYDKVSKKLNQDHKMFFESLYRIDNSAKDVTDYDIIKAIKWVAKSESNSKKVIILSENFDSFRNECNENIKCLTPTQFLESVDIAQKLCSTKMFSTLDDSLMAVFFIFGKDKKNIN